MLLYTAPYFANYLPADVFHHFLLFVYCIRTLCSDCLIAQDINKVRGFLFKFCELTGRLYGREHLTANNHLCCHLAALPGRAQPERPAMCKYGTLEPVANRGSQA